MLTARLRRLEELVRPPESALTIEQWCALDGTPVEPSADVRHRVEAQASGHWRWAAWAPESGCVVLLGEGDELQVVEL